MTACITVRGIDRDGESRSLSTEHLPADVLASDLCRSGWRYAQLTRCGKVLGEVALDARLRRRTWRGKD